MSDNFTRGIATVSASTGRILIVDDDPAGLETERQALNRAGFEVFVAENGRAAILKATAFEPDIVLADLCLPDVSGLDVLKTLRSERIDLPVVMLTAFATIQSAVEAMKLGAADYLEKPVPSEDLVQIISQVIKRGGQRNGLTAEHIEASSIVDRRVLQALETVRTRFQEADLTVASVAEELSISRSFLARLVKRQEKLTPFRHEE